MLAVSSRALLVLAMTLRWSKTTCDRSLPGMLNGEAPLVGQDKTKVPGVQVNETSRDSQSDLLFSWDECDFCSGYRGLLHLSHVTGNRTLSYPLRVGVTSLLVTGIAQRTKYRLVIKAISSDNVTDLEIEGRTRSNGRPPPPVQQLIARALTNSSLRAEWISTVADGFVVKVFHNGVLVHEKLLPFANKSELRLDRLEPATQYGIEVRPFYEPNTEETAALAVTTQARTLPSKLPDTQLRFEEHGISSLKLFWKNPEWPIPVSRRIKCIVNDTTNDNGVHAWIEAVVEGSSESLTLTSPMFSRWVNAMCMLRTLFSTDPWAVTISEFVVSDPRHRRPFDDNDTLISCTKSEHDRHSTILLRSMDVPFNATLISKNNIRGLKSDSIYIQFNASREYKDYVFVSHQYSLCKSNESCPEWAGVPNGTTNGSTASNTDSLSSMEMRLIPEDLSPWTPYLLNHRIVIRCRNSEQAEGKLMYSSGKSHKLPILSGPVPSVSALNVSRKEKKAELLWQYNHSIVPDFFLLTRCTRSSHQAGASSKCSSQSLSNALRSVYLDELEEERTTYVSLQVGKANPDTQETVVSEPQVTSFYVTGQERAVGNIRLTTEEVANSSKVLLYIHYETTEEPPGVVEFHVNICGKLLPLWEGNAVERLVKALSKTCEGFTTSLGNGTVQLRRRPWAEYEIRVGLCHGRSDLIPMASTMLPVYKPAPQALSELTWDEEQRLLSWEYNSNWSPSGFLVSFCAEGEDPVENCTNIKTGPIDRRYHVNLNDIPGDKVIAFVSSFVTFEGSQLLGLRSELVIIKPSTASTGNG